MLQGHKNSVISIDLSPAGNVLATGSGDWQARICESFFFFFFLFSLFSSWTVDVDYSFFEIGSYNTAPA